ncbi:MAG: hypothetical protein Q9M25_09410 [Mariprofundaceae bacterium]|nr:hypothetical protein [Mariprofundaceae bacterium]
MPELATSNMPESKDAAAMHQRITQLFRNFYNRGMHPSNTMPGISTPQQYSAMRVMNEGENHDNKD